MSKSKHLNPKATVAGRSFVLNLVFVLLNIFGLTMVTIGYHENFENQSFTFKLIGNLILLFSTIGIIVFKGRLMFNNLARVFVGSLFIVSGLVKANDPVGFAYKLEEYFEDGALAYRIKEWFGMPEFSLEFLIPFALTLSVLICVIEIVLGVLTIFGQKMKWVSTLLLLMMLFFTFLTWHTASCDGNKMFKDRDSYSFSDPIAKDKLEAAKTNKSIKVISNDGKTLVIDEMKQPQCVDDCGCFGDALKGSVGRSLTPKESLWKDIVLTYFVFWIFLAAFKRCTLEEENKKYFWITSLVFIAFFSWVFGWLFPLFFGLVALVISAGILRNKSNRIPKYWFVIVYVVFLCSVMVSYVLLFDPIKDYRPYAVGVHLPTKMKDGQEGKYVSLLVYKNIKTGEKREYEASAKNYIESKIWENKDWKYIEMTQKEIVPVRIPSITEQFNPYLPLESVSKIESELPYVKNQMNQAKISGLRIYDKSTKSNIEITAEEFNLEDYPENNYFILDTIELEDPEFTEVNIKELITTSKKIIVLTVKNLKQANFEKIGKYKSIYSKAKKDNIPMVMIVSGNVQEINYFRKRNNFNIPIFLNDETELKAISRSNPALLVLKSGTVVAKYPHRSTPDYLWLKTNVLK